MATRVYLDNNVYNRPFDDQTQPCIWLETLAVSIIFQMVESKSIAKAAYFVTCDDRLIRRYRANLQQIVTVCGPTEFVENFSGE